MISRRVWVLLLAVGCGDNFTPPLIGQYVAVDNVTIFAHYRARDLNTPCRLARDGDTLRCLPLNPAPDERLRTVYREPSCDKPEKIISTDRPETHEHEHSFVTDDGETFYRAGDEREEITTPLYERDGSGCFGSGCPCVRVLEQLREPAGRLFRLPISDIVTRADFPTASEAHDDAHQRFFVSEGRADPQGGWYLGMAMRFSDYINGWVPEATNVAYDVFSDPACTNKLITAAVDNVQPVAWECNPRVSSPCSLVARGEEVMPSSTFQLGDDGSCGFKALDPATRYFLIGDPFVVPSGDPFLIGDGRMKLSLPNLNGQPVISNAASFFDSDIQATCGPRLTLDGILRCVPEVMSDLVYSDPQCLEPRAAGVASSTATAGARFIEKPMTDDWPPPDPYFWPLAFGDARYEVWELGAVESQPAGFNHDNNGECRPFVAREYLTYRVLLGQRPIDRSPTVHLLGY